MQEKYTEGLETGKRHLLLLFSNTLMAGIFSFENFLKLSVHYKTFFIIYSSESTSLMNKSYISILME